MLNIANIINWFFASKKNNNKKELIRFSDQLIIPRMKEYQGERIIYQKIKEYKEQYSNILKNFLAGTRNLNNHDLYYELNMVISLTTKIFVNERDKLFENNSDLRNTINYAKYELYTSEIERLKSDLMYRLIALKELEITNSVPKRNLNILRQEIEYLSVGMLISMLQTDGIKQEKEYIESILQDKKTDENEVDTYYNNLIKPATKVLSFEDINRIKRMKVGKKVKIAILEKKIEEYFYKNPNDIDKLISRLKILEETWDSGVTTNLTYLINELEEEFIFYDRYGNTVDNRIKERLYKLKFNIIANDYTLNECNLLQTEDKLAHDIYEREIDRRIDYIVSGKNPILSDVFGNDNIKEALNVLKGVFSGELRIFDSNLILSDVYNLQLLEALKSKDSLANWFKRNVDLKAFLGDEIYEKYFRDTDMVSFNKSVPIDTICYILQNCNGDEKHIPLVKLYLMIDDRILEKNLERNHQISNNTYYIPEGINSINITLENTPMGNGFSDSNFEDILKYMITDRRVVFPKSLKRATIVNNREKYLESLIFQNGVEEINYTGVFKEMNIPASVKKLSINFEASEKFKSYLGKKVFKYDYNVADELTMECNRLTTGVWGDLVFEEYEKSPLLKGNLECIKSLPKLLKYGIVLIGNKFLDSENSPYYIKRKTFFLTNTLSYEIKYENEMINGIVTPMISCVENSYPRRSWDDKFKEIKDYLGIRDEVLR